MPLHVDLDESDASAEIDVIEALTLHRIELALLEKFLVVFCSNCRNFGDLFPQRLPAGRDRDAAGARGTVRLSLR